MVTPPRQACSLWIPSTTAYVPIIVAANMRCACHCPPRRVDAARRGGRTSPYGTCLRFVRPAQVAQRVLRYDAEETKWVPERGHNERRPCPGRDIAPVRHVWRTSARCRLSSRKRPVGEGGKVERAGFCVLGAVISEDASCRFCKMWSDWFGTLRGY